MLLRDLEEKARRLGVERESRPAHPQARDRNLKAEPLRRESAQGHLERRHREPALGDVVARENQPSPHRLEHRVDPPPLPVEFKRRQIPARLAGQEMSKLRRAVPGLPRAAQDQHAVPPLDRARDGNRIVLEHAQSGHDGRRLDRASRGRLVVEGDVPRHVGDRRAGRPLRPESARGLAETADASHELVEDLRVLGISKVETVGQRDGPGAHRHQIPKHLADRVRGAPVGIRGHVPGIAVDGEGAAERRAGHRDQDRRVGLPRADHHAALHLGVVIAEDRRARSQLGRADHPPEEIRVVLDGRERRRPRPGRTGPLRPLVLDSRGDHLDRRVAHRLSPAQDPIPRIRPDASDDRGLSTVVHARAARSPRCRWPARAEPAAPAPRARTAPGSRSTRALRAGSRSEASEPDPDRRPCPCRRPPPAREEAQAIPPAPRSLNPNGTPCACSHASAARFASRSTRLRNGSGTCTWPRCPVASSSSIADAKDAPPKPVSSVGFPMSTITYGSRFAASGTRLRTIRSSRTTPSETTFTRQFSS